MGTYWANNGHSLHGFLVPDQRVSPSTLSSSSTYSEQGLRAGGVGEPGSDSARLVIEATGDQDTDLVAQVEQGGHPRLGTGACRVSWRTSVEAAAARRGWNAPNMIDGFSTATWGATTNTLLCSLALADGRIVVAYRYGSTTAYFDAYTPDTDAWLGQTAFPVLVHASGGIALAQLPEGHVLVIMRAATGRWVAYRYSIIDAISGGTWVTHALDPFPTAPAISSGRSRLLVLPTGDMSYWIASNSGDIEQHASDSHGAQFSAISTDDATTRFDAIVTARGKILLCAVKDSVLYAYTLGSAWTSFESITPVTIASAAYPDIWLVADPCGRCYLYIRAVADDITALWYTDDDGATWAQATCGAWGNADASTYPTAGQAVHAGGAVWLAHQFVDATATQDDSVCLLRLGGWSSVTLGTPGTPDDSARYGSGSGGAYLARHLLPWARPSESIGWSTTVAGAPTCVLTGGRAEIQLGGGTDRYYVERATAPANGEAVITRFRGRVTVGGDSASPAAAWDSVVSSGVDFYSVAVYLTTTTITIYDQGGGVQLALVTPSGGLSALEIDIICVVDPVVAGSNHTWAGWKRPQDSTWTEIYDSTMAAYPAGTRRVRFGCWVSSVTTFDYRLFWAATTNVGSPLFGAPSSWHFPDIIGRMLTALPAPLDKRSALGRRQTWLRGKDGPGRCTDAFTLSARADYPIEAVCWQHSPSPARGWRASSAATVAVEVLFNLVSSTGTIQTSFGSSMLAMLIRGARQRYVRLMGDTGAGATQIAQADLATGLTSLEYARTGNVVRVDTGGSTASTRYVWAGELVGAHVDLGGGKVRRIAAHTEGAWNVASGRRVELILDADDPDVPYDASEPASGSLDIWHHSGVLVVPGVDATTHCRLGWAIPAGVATDPKFRLGSLIIGRVQLVGRVWSRGWGCDYQPNARDAEVRPRSFRRRAIGPVAREISIGWPDGVDLSRLRDANPSPDFLSDAPGDTIGMASRDDVAYLLAGLLAETRSGEVPLVVLPRVPVSVSTITDPTLYCYAHQVSGVSIESVIGEEGAGELVRVGSVALREIV